MKWMAKGEEAKNGDTYNEQLTPSPTTRRQQEMAILKCKKAKRKKNCVRSTAISRPSLPASFHIFLFSDAIRLWKIGHVFPSETTQCCVNGLVTVLTNLTFYHLCARVLKTGTK